MKIKISLRVDKEIVRQIKLEGKVSDIINKILSDKYTLKPKMSDKSVKRPLKPLKPIGNMVKGVRSMPKTKCPHYQERGSFCTLKRCSCSFMGDSSKCKEWEG